MNHALIRFTTAVAACCGLVAGSMALPAVAATRQPVAGGERRLRPRTGASHRRTAATLVCPWLNGYLLGLTAASHGIGALSGSAMAATGRGPCHVGGRAAGRGRVRRRRGLRWVGRTARAGQTVLLVGAAVAVTVLGLAGTATADPAPVPAPAPLTAPALCRTIVFPDTCRVSTAPGSPRTPRYRPPSGPVPGQDDSGGSDPGFFDIPGQIEKAIDGWFGKLVKLALDPVLHLVGVTLLSTPNLTDGRDRAGLGRRPDHREHALRPVRAGRRGDCDGSRDGADPVRA